MLSNNSLACAADDQQGPPVFQSKRVHAAETVVRWTGNLGTTTSTQNSYDDFYWQGSEYRPENQTVGSNDNLNHEHPVIQWTGQVGTTHRSNDYLLQDPPRFGEPRGLLKLSGALWCHSDHATSPFTANHEGSIDEKERCDCVLEGSMLKIHPTANTSRGFETLDLSQWTLAESGCDKKKLTLIHKFLPTRKVDLFADSEQAAKDWRQAIIQIMNNNPRDSTTSRGQSWTASLQFEQKKGKPVDRECDVKKTVSKVKHGTLRCYFSHWKVFGFRCATVGRVTKDGMYCPPIVPHIGEFLRMNDIMAVLEDDGRGWSRGWYLPDDRWMALSRSCQIFWFPTDCIADRTKPSSRYWGRVCPLTINVVGAKYLQSRHSKTKPNPWVSVQVGSERHDLALKRSSCSPIWLEEVEFEIETDDEIVTFTVYDWDHVRRDEVIGRLELPAARIVKDCEAAWSSADVQRCFESSHDLQIFKHFPGTKGYKLFAGENLRRSDRCPWEALVFVQAMNRSCLPRRAISQRGNESSSFTNVHRDGSAAHSSWRHNEGVLPITTNASSPHSPLQVSLSSACNSFSVKHSHDFSQLRDHGVVTNIDASAIHSSMTSLSGTEIRDRMDSMTFARVPSPLASLMINNHSRKFKVCVISAQNQPIKKKSQIHVTTCNANGESGKSFRTSFCNKEEHPIFEETFDVELDENFIFMRFHIDEVGYSFLSLSQLKDLSSDINRLPTSEANDLTTKSSNLFPIPLSLKRPQDELGRNRSIVARYPGSFAVKLVNPSGEAVKNRRGECAVIYLKVSSGRLSENWQVLRDLDHFNKSNGEGLQTENFEYFPGEALALGQLSSSVSANENIPSQSDVKPQTENRTPQNLMEGPSEHKQDDGGMKEDSILFEVLECKNLPCKDRCVLCLAQVGDEHFEMKACGSGIISGRNSFMLRNDNEVQLIVLDRDGPFMRTVIGQINISAEDLITSYMESMETSQATSNPIELPLIGPNGVQVVEEMNGLISALVARCRRCTIADVSETVREEDRKCNMSSGRHSISQIISVFAGTEDLHFQKLYLKIKACNLTFRTSSKQCNPYCKGRIGERHFETSKQSATIEADWSDEIFEFELVSRKEEVYIRVLDWDALEMDRVIGTVYLSMDQVLGEIAEKDKGDRSCKVEISSCYKLFSSDSEEVRSSEGNVAYVVLNLSSEPFNDVDEKICDSPAKGTDGLVKAGCSDVPSQICASSKCEGPRHMKQEGVSGQERLLAIDADDHVREKDNGCHFQTQVKDSWHTAFNIQATNDFVGSSGQTFPKSTTASSGADRFLNVLPVMNDCLCGGIGAENDAPISMALTFAEDILPFVLDQTLLSDFTSSFHHDLCVATGESYSRFEIVRTEIHDMITVIIAVQPCWMLRNERTPKTARKIVDDISEQVACVQSFLRRAASNLIRAEEMCDEANLSTICSDDASSIIELLEGHDQEQHKSSLSHMQTASTFFAKPRAQYESSDRSSKTVPRRSSEVSLFLSASSSPDQSLSSSTSSISLFSATCSRHILGSRVEDEDPIPPAWEKLFCHMQLFRDRRIKERNFKKWKECQGRLTTTCNPLTRWW